MSNILRDLVRKLKRMQRMQLSMGFKGVDLRSWALWNFDHNTGSDVELLQTLNFAFANKCSHIKLQKKCSIVC